MPELLVSYGEVEAGEALILVLRDLVLILSLTLVLFALLCQVTAIECNNQPEERVGQKGVARVPVLGDDAANHASQDAANASHEPAV